MDFDLDPQQRDMACLAHDIVESFGETYWAQVDRDGEFPHAYWRQLAECGLLGIVVPEEYGGVGAALLDLAIVTEALAAAGGGLEATGPLITGPVFGGFLLARHADRALKQELLPSVTAGALWAGGFTETESGSNVASIKTTATRHGDRFLVSGSKMFVSMADSANHLLLLARAASQAQDGLSLLAVDLPDDAITATPMPALGCHYLTTCAVYFDDLEVPATRLIGAEGAAWKPLFDVLNPERVVLAAAAVGTGHWVLRQAVKYAKQRAVWNGTPIGAHQGIQFPLAEASMRLRAAQLCVYEAARLFDRADPKAGPAAARAKYLAVNAALAAADRAIQTFGGAGYIHDTGIDRHWRNLRLNRIAPVTDEMTLAYIARSELGLPRSY